MAAATISLPRSAGAPLIVVAADFLIGLFTSKPAPKAKAVSQAAAVAKDESVNVWQLYRLAAGSDSVSPKAAAKLRARADKI